MEGLSNNDDGFEKPISDKKKSRKRGEVLGSFAVESKVPEVSTEPLDAKKPERPLFQTADAVRQEAERSQLFKFNPESSPLDDAEDDAETTSEVEAPLEQLGPAEAPLIRQAIAQEAKQQQAEQSPAAEVTPEQEAGDIAVEHLHDRIIAGEDFDEAYDGVIAELDAEDLEIADEFATEDAEDQPQTDESSTEDPDAVHDFGEDEIVFHRTAPETAEDGDDSVVAPITPTAAVAAAAGAAAGVASGGGGVPPATPRAGFGAGFGGPHIPATPNVAPRATAANTIPEDGPERYNNYPGPASALVGGIVGYLIGRRRGRIKTEKKLLPIQKKLEKQVEDMHWQLHAKETQLRKVAARQVERQGPTVVEKLAAVPVVTEATRSATAERLVQDQRQRAPEAHSLHGPQSTREHIGHMLIAAEAAPALRVAGRAESRPQAGSKSEVLSTLKQAKEQPVKTERQVLTMNRTELLQLSEKIVIDGSSLRQIYETHLIGEHGLRRLVTEHLRGGDLKKALRREVVEREIDFERDPAMRDIAVSTTQAAAVGGPTTLNRLVEQAAASVAGDSEEVAYYKARNNYEVEQLQQQRKQRRAMDIGITSIIAILLTLIIVMYMMRR